MNKEHKYIFGTFRKIVTSGKIVQNIVFQ